LAHAAHPDHLVVDQVGRHADERQLAFLLADDLVPGGERDQVGEALQGDRHAILNVGGDRVVQRQEFGHQTFSTIGRWTMRAGEQSSMVYGQFGMLKNTVSPAPCSTISNWYTPPPWASIGSASSVARRSAGTSSSSGSWAVAGSSAK